MKRYMQVYNKFVEDIKKGYLKYWEVYLRILNILS